MPVFPQSTQSSPDRQGNCNYNVCYYPEHWPETMWEDDLERMLESGIEVIRIAEFAWTLTEPAEGCFTFAFFDRFLDLCREKGMKVIFAYHGKILIRRESS